MKFVTFEIATTAGTLQRIGVITDNGIIDLNAGYRMYLEKTRRIYRAQELADAIVPPNLLKLIEGGEISMDAAWQAVDFIIQAGITTGKQEIRMIYQPAEVRLMAPIPRPVSIIDCSAFEQHHINFRKAKGRDPVLPELWYKIPQHYRTSHTDVIGTGESIIWPSYTEKLDYELELGICIGKQGINIAEEDAEKYIFGYTIFNDVSARDIQTEEVSLGLGPAKAKCFQNSNIMGPCLVTPDEINANSLRMVARINGEIWTDGNSKDMYYKFPKLISHISKDDYLYPGMFICSGTVGFGSGAEQSKWIKPGDMIELEIEGIGKLLNQVEKK